MKEFKKEKIVKRSQSGFIPMICNSIKDGDLDNLNEKIKLTFLEVNPKLKRHLKKTIKKKEMTKDSVCVLLKLMEWGDQIARKVFTEEIVKRYQSGNIPIIFDLIKKGYLDNLNEEIKLIFLEGNPKLKHHLEDTSKKMTKESVYIFLKLMEWGDQISEEIIKKKKLKEIDLSDFNLAELPECLGQLTSLQTLNLGGNQLTKLPASIRQLTALKTLDLGKNQLTKLPAWIGQLTSLQHLNLGNNQLAELPPTFGKLIALQTFNLWSNRLNELPTTFGQLNSLQILNLWSNRLKELPTTFVQLTSLQTLNLGGNQLTKFPASIEQLTSLQHLNLQNNQLTELPAWLGQLTSLQTLDLELNQLTELPASFGQLTALQTLNLGGNQLTELPAWLGQLTSLQILKIEENQLTELPALIGQLTALQTLYLWDNQITKLPDTFGQLTALQTLYLDFNQLPELPATLVQLKALKDLSFKHNQLPELPDSRTHKIIEELKKNKVVILNNPSRPLKNKSGEILEWIHMVVLYIFGVLGVNVFFIRGIITEPVSIGYFLCIVLVGIWNYWLFVSFQQIWTEIKMIRSMSDMQAMQIILDNLD